MARLNKLKLARTLERTADELEEILALFSDIPEIYDDYLSEDEIKVLGDACDILFDTAGMLGIEVVD